MRHLFARRPSPSMAVAFAALVVALGGTAVALPGKNTVDSGDIKKGGVKRADIAANAIIGKKVKNESLTGSDVQEKTFRQVPSAGSAGSVGGVTFRPFKYSNEGTGAAEQILDFGGLTLEASCDLDVLTLTAGSKVADAELGSYTVEADAPSDPTGAHNEAYDVDFDPGDSANVLPDDEDEEVGSLRYSKRDGTSVSVQFHVFGGNNGAGADAGRCAVSGVALSF